MNRFLKGTLLAVTGASLAASAQAGGACPPLVDVNADIAVSTTWTANNQYNLTQQIFVLPGATLTIEPGTVVASTATVNGGGSLAITRGAQIVAEGTSKEPITFTSSNDVATWVNCDPSTGTWRAAANEWGNITIMGEGFISEDANPGNVPTCNANNTAIMEGLVGSGFNQRYGGGDDNDDSGTLRYVSLRYGGRVIGLGNELNGLSLGGIGRETDIDYVEIMNNVDDGIEIWGGTVNVSHASIWNIGDDSFDIDQGWRGKAQFVLIVQGYSLDASQGSGVGDNAFEMDGAEQCDWQPVTTAVIYNATVIGQPDGDHGTAWRDNARVQHRNSIFMDLGSRLVAFDNVDGDGGLGYGCGSPATLSWADTWTTAYNAVPAHPNDCPPGTYLAQTDGFLAEIRDSVFYNNTAGDAYTEATARGVFDASKNNAIINDSPLARVQRAPAVTLNGNLDMEQVISLDPRPRNEALNAVDNAPLDGFFLPARFRGAFGPNNNWLCGWSASDAFGFLQGCTDNINYFCYGTAYDCPCTTAQAGDGSQDATDGFGGCGAFFDGGANGGAGVTLTLVTDDGLAASVANDAANDQVGALLSRGPNQGSSALIFQGTSEIMSPFGDGFRCAGGSVIRCGTRAFGPVGGFPANTIEFAPGTFGPGQNNALAVQGQVPAGGGLRTYQGWFRNVAPFCNSQAFNLTNAAKINWLP